MPPFDSTSGGLSPVFLRRVGLLDCWPMSQAMQREDDEKDDTEDERDRSRAVQPASQLARLDFICALVNLPNHFEDRVLTPGR